MEAEPEGDCSEKVYDDTGSDKVLVGVIDGRLEICTDGKDRTADLEVTGDVYGGIEVATGHMIQSCGRPVFALQKSSDDKGKVELELMLAINIDAFR